MKIAGAMAIGKLIEYHNNKDDEKFNEWANYIADAYKESGDDHAAELIRNKLTGRNKIEPSLDASSFTATSANNIRIRTLIDQRRISPKIGNCLLRAGINTTKDLTYISEHQLMKIHNFGNKMLEELKGFCDDNQIEIGSSIGNIPQFSKGDVVINTVDKYTNGYTKRRIEKGSVLTIGGLKEVIGCTTHMPLYMCYMDDSKNEFDGILCSAGEIQIV